MLDDGPAAGHAARPRAAARHRRARARDHAEPPGLPRGLRRRPRGARRDRRAARAAAVARGPGLAGGDPPAGIAVTVECPDLCPRFTARVFEDVTIGPSPLWLAARLLAAGHAADLERRRHHQLRDAAHRPAAARLRPRPRRGRRAHRAPGAATARRSRRSTAQRARSTTGMVVICDADGPTSIAGIMGGARSEVGDATTRVLLEAASWDGADDPAHRRSRSGCAARPRRGSRRALSRRADARGAGGRERALGRAVRRARAGRARSTSAGRGRSRTPIRAAPRARRGAARRRDRARSAAARSSRRSASRSTRGADASTRARTTAAAT